jgi:DNA-binding transcriptional ArsR family regulator
LPIERQVQPDRGPVRRGGRRLDLCRIGEAAELTMPRTRAKATLSPEALELVARRFRALGDATRLGLLQALFARERTVQELSAITGASQANASKHLALLFEQGLVARRRDGLFTRYRINDATLQPLCRLVCDSLADRHEAVRTHLAS